MNDLDIEQKQVVSKENFLSEILLLLKSNILSNDLIQQAELNANLDSGYSHILFPEGQSEIFAALNEYLDSKMLEELEKLSRPAKIRDQIALAIETRLIEVVDKQVILNMLGYYLLPKNIGLGFTSVANTCDIIWRYAGDKSTDFNYYTKRGLLISAYAASSAFYLADDSENRIDTRNFIKNALDNIINIASLKKTIKLPKKEDIPIIRLFS